MGVDETYFFDSYAIYEIVIGSPGYSEYVHNIRFVTTKLNLIELHYRILRELGRKAADTTYDELKSYIIKISDEVIKNANEFRYKNKGKKLSYTDCIGYVLARTRGMKFLTGDNAFKGMEGVEFVK